ncbi:hypothetical protein Q8F55_001545 [Vanrija albida]|uniref:Uncharacterized protein n=1 Tax=Vanrija albida TaxID=181172 RepID=A0ABR3QH62_9TREE
MRARTSPLALAAALAAAGVAAGAALTEHNFTISDMSPMLTYTNAGAWNASWTQSNWTTWVGNDTRIGYGDSLHTTTEVGSSVALSFVGTGVAFFGSADGGVSLQVDGGAAATTTLSNVVNGSLAGIGGLEYAYHTVKLALASGSALTLKSVVITTAIGGEGARASNTTMWMFDETPTQYLQNPNITKSSQQDWSIIASVSEQIDTPESSSSRAAAYPRLSTHFSTAWMSFAVPANTSLMTLRGPVGYNYEKYKVTLDPAPPFGPASLTLSAQSPWLGYPQTLWFASIDPTQQYKVTVDFVPSGDLPYLTYFEAAAAQFVSAVGGTGSLPGTGSTGGNTTSGGGGGHGNNGSSNGSGSGNGASKSSTPVGAIAGGAAGGAVALILAGVLLWWCLRKRNRRDPTKKRVVGTLLDPKRRESHGSEFEIEPLDPIVTAQPAYGGYGGSAHSLVQGGSGGVTPLPPPASYLTRPSPANTYSSPSSPVDFSAGYGTATPPIAADTKAALAGSAGQHGLADRHGEGYGRPLPSPYSHSHSQPQYPPSQGYSQGYSQSHTESSGPATPTTSSQGGKARYAPAPAQPVVNVEQDAGRVPVPQPAPPAESVPPTYDPRWANE